MKMQCKKKEPSLREETPYFEKALMLLLLVIILGGYIRNIREAVSCH